ncbi:hypothetical protein ACFPMF_01810 [Larkinella bovis]|uniref:Uncharacterized protein n=1 Tax=Larkinella bovis TaxID=683041 RepID=A0ABW0I7D5_9BACT
MAQLSETLTVSMENVSTARKSRQDARNEAIRREFVRLHDKKKLRLDVVYQQLADQYYLSQKTIMSITFKWGRYRE